MAVADGKKFNLFSNTGDETSPALTAMPEPDIESEPSEQFGQS